jgi:hypothetical protein
VTALRNRLVTEQDGIETVSGTLLSDSEILPMINIEQALHVAGGWTVSRYGHTLRMQKGDTVRWTWVRSRPPLEDTL